MIVLDQKVTEESNASNCERREKKIYSVGREGEGQRSAATAEAKAGRLDAVARAIDPNRFGQWVVSGVEWTREAFAKRSHLGLGIGEALCNEVIGLVGGDGVLGHGGDFGLPRVQLRRRRALVAAVLARARVFQLSKAGQQARSVRFHLRRILLITQETKFHRVPVAGGEFLDVVITRSQRRQANLLREIRKVRVRKQRSMSVKTRKKYNRLGSHL